jgi:hypothetical protein
LNGVNDVKQTNTSESTSFVFESAIEKFKMFISTGIIDILAKVIKERKLNIVFYKLINTSLNREEFPQQLKESYCFCL